MVSVKRCRGHRNANAFDAINAVVPSQSPAVGDCQLSVSNSQLVGTIKPPERILVNGIIAKVITDERATGRVIEVVEVVSHGLLLINRGAAVKRCQYPVAAIWIGVGPSFCARCGHATYRQFVAVNVNDSRARTSTCAIDSETICTVV